MTNNPKELIGINLNIALANKKLCNYEECLKFSQYVIDEDDTNPKAW